MTKNEKELLLNKINNLTYQLSDRFLPILKDSCKWGLQKGKNANSAWTIETLYELADALTIYHSEEFTLNDIQDYNGGKL